MVDGKGGRETMIPSGFEQYLGIDFFTYVLPWLLTFAIVYGITSHIGEGGIPKSKPARMVIALALAFIVAPVVSPYVTFFMGMIGSLAVVVAGLLVFIVFLEVLGIKGRGVIVDKETGKPVGEERVSIFEAHPVGFSVLFVIIGVLVFVGAGGLQALGWSTAPIYITYNWPLIAFLIIVALALWWMASEK
ncbi:MAG: hypothetical protein JSV92_01595 [archaeon]|nr:MAG: hypothetical protein JSV92_01595 [archaeon]